MTTRDYTANVISATKVVPDGNFKDSKASGVWDINEALDLIKGGNWPNAANVNPASFVDALFSTDLWTSDGSSAQTITNNIDLSNKGGLVWIKDRDNAKAHVLVDTARISGDTDNYLMSDSTNAQTAHSNEFGDFTSTGYTIPRNTEAGYTNTNTGRDYVGWTFRKQPKFFDVVTYTGTQDGDKTISHSLNTTVGMAIIKRYDANGYDWHIYHRSTGTGNYLLLNTTGAAASGSIVTGTSNTTITLSQSNGMNTSGASYLVYLFAHNDDDGGFGEPGDQDIIKCGTYTGNNSTTGPVIDLGFEPQWLFIRHTDANGNSSFILDNMRGVVTGGNDNSLSPNANSDEQTSSDLVEFNATGFQLKRANDNVNGNSNNYIYMAIRRGGMQTPTAASSVFTVDDGMAANTSSVPGFTANHVVDLGLSTTTSSASRVLGTRLLGDTFLITEGTDAKIANSVARTSGYQNGFFFTNGSADSTRTGWMWARARGYFDVVTYTGDNSQHNENHNLGVVPEMIWTKSHNHTYEWGVYHKDIGVGAADGLNGTGLTLDTNDGLNAGADSPLYQHPTATQFQPRGRQNQTKDYVAYLFATVAGVSKVDSFTQSGATNVACGFSGDTPSFIILKRTDASGNWYLFDSARGIVAGNDPHIYLDTTDAEITNADIVDPYSGGFATTANLANGDYIFYAIAAIS